MSAAIPLAEAAPCDAEPVLHYIPYEDFVAWIGQVSDAVARSRWAPDFVIGVGRGGLVPAVYLSHRLALRALSIDHSSKVPGFADELLAKVAATSATGTRLLFVDDMNDSGGTIQSIRRVLTAHGCEARNLRFAVMLNNLRSQVEVDYWAQTIDRDGDKRWFVFPWEAVEDRAALIEEALSVPERLA